MYVTQDGTADSDWVTAAATGVGKHGSSVILAGTSKGAWQQPSGTTTSAGLEDFAAIALDTGSSGFATPAPSQSFGSASASGSWTLANTDSAVTIEPSPEVGSDDASNSLVTNAGATGRTPAPVAEAVAVAYTTASTSASTASNSVSTAAPVPAEDSSPRSDRLNNPGATLAPSPTPFAVPSPSDEGAWATASSSLTVDATRAPVNGGSPVHKPPSASSTSKGMSTVSSPPGGRGGVFVLLAAVCLARRLCTILFC